MGTNLISKTLYIQFIIEVETKSHILLIHKQDPKCFANDYTFNKTEAAAKTFNILLLLFFKFYFYFIN